MNYRKATMVFLLLSLVSLFADITYEGARSILGAYLELLEASAVIAGLISIGDLVSYLTRGLGGFIAGYLRSSKVYWFLVLMGYSINVFAVPLLAFVGRWEYAFILILVERIGKGLRAPARDVILAEVTEHIGKGKGFGLHEVMDQIGAVLGPSIVAWTIYSTGGDYRAAFIYLFIPALIAVALVITSIAIYPNIRSVKKAVSDRKQYYLGRRFLYYVASMAFLAMGFMHWGLIAYHYKAISTIPPYVIPLFYTAAMLSDAIIALPAGHLYDRIGLRILIITPWLAVLFIPFILSGSMYMLLFGSIIWGFLMGIYETIMRAAVADLVPIDKRAYAYGVYGVTFGISWSIGNAIIGYLYQIMQPLIIYYVLAMEAIAFILLLKTIREK